MFVKIRRFEYCKVFRMKGTISLYLVSMNVSFVNFCIFFIIRVFFFFFLEWFVDEVKFWVLDLFGKSELVKNFEDEEIDGRILFSLMVRIDEVMEKFGLNIFGKKGKFL